MSDSQLKKTDAISVLGKLHAAVNRHDPETISSLCARDVQWEDPAAPHTLHGSNQVVAFHRDIMFPALPDVHIEVIDGPYFSLDYDGIAMRLGISGTMTG